jgi:heme A synthase
MHRIWPVVAWVILTLWALGSSVLARVRPELEPNRTSVLLALAFTPIILAFAAVVVGAALWLLWVALAFAIALALWWAWDATTRLRQAERPNWQ